MRGDQYARDMRHCQNTKIDFFTYNPNSPHLRGALEPHPELDEGRGDAAPGGDRGHGLISNSCVNRVVIARGPHLIPFRTQSLSPSAPMVLCLKARESRSPPGLLKNLKSIPP